MATVPIPQSNGTLMAPGGQRITAQGGKIDLNGNGNKPFIPVYDRSLFMRRDKWREYFNPLWQLNIPMVVARLQASQLGIVSDIQWIYRFIERRNPTMIALIDRRLSALKKLDWDVKALDESVLPDGATTDMAEAQRKVLRDAYDQVDNIKETISALEKAVFRGFAHLEKHYDDEGNVIHFEPVPQWNWARDGLFGSWWYNRSAFSVYGGGGGTEPIDETNFLIREVEDPIDEVAVIAFIRKNIALRDWDSYLASYGIPSLFIEMPADVPPELQAEYQAAAERTESNSRGVLPFGAKATVHAEGSRGTTPHKANIDYNDQQVVLAGTGGKLTMLTESGSGQLAGGAHSDTFDEIALGSAIVITEIFQRQHDKLIINKKFPGQPILAYFEISAKEVEDTAAVITNVNTLAQAGYEVDLAQIEEITGLKLSIRPPINKAVVRATQGNPDIQSAPATENRLRKAWDWIKNRISQSDQAKVQKELIANTTKKLTPIQIKQLKALAVRYKNEVLKDADTVGMDVLKNRSDVFMKTLPSELKKMALSPEKEKLLMDGYAAALLNGAAQE